MRNQRERRHECVQGINLPASSPTGAASATVVGDFGELDMAAVVSSLTATSAERVMIRGTESKIHERRMRDGVRESLL